MAMDDTTLALIAAGAGLVGATVGSLVALRIAQLQSRERRASELSAAVASFGHAVDRLMLEIGQLPPSSGRTGVTLRSAVERRPYANWIVGQLTRWSLGLPAMRALDGLMAATNRLSLVAPEPMVRDVGRIPALLGRLAQRDQRAVAELDSARARLLAAARSELGLRPRWRQAYIAALLRPTGHRSRSMARRSSSKVS